MKILLLYSTETSVHALLSIALACINSVLVIEAAGTRSQGSRSRSIAEFREAGQRPAAKESRTSFISRFENSTGGQPIQNNPGSKLVYAGNGTELLYNQTEPRGRSISSFIYANNVTERQLKRTGPRGRSVSSFRIEMEPPSILAHSSSRSRRRARYEFRSAGMLIKVPSLQSISRSRAITEFIKTVNSNKKGFRKPSTTWYMRTCRREIKSTLPPALHRKLTQNGRSINSAKRIRHRLRKGPATTESPNSVTSYECNWQLNEMLREAEMESEGLAEASKTWKWKKLTPCVSLRPDERRRLEQRRKHIGRRRLNRKPTTLRPRRSKMRLAPRICSEESASRKPELLVEQGLGRGIHWLLPLSKNFTEANITTPGPTLENSTVPYAHAHDLDLVLSTSEATTVIPEPGLDLDNTTVSHNYTTQTEDLGRGVQMLPTESSTTEVPTGSENTSTQEPAEFGRAINGFLEVRSSTESQQSPPVASHKEVPQAQGRGLWKGGKPRTVHRLVDEPLPQTTAEAGLWDFTLAPIPANWEKRYELPERRPDRTTRKRPDRHKWTGAYYK